MSVFLLEYFEHVETHSQYKESMPVSLSKLQSLLRRLYSKSPPKFTIMWRLISLISYSPYKESISTGAVVSVSIHQPELLLLAKYKKDRRIWLHVEHLIESYKESMLTSLTRASIPVRLVKWPIHTMQCHVYIKYLAGGSGYSSAAGKAINDIL